VEDDDEDLLWRDAKGGAGLNCNGDVYDAKRVKGRFRVEGGEDGERSFCSNNRPPVLHIVMHVKNVEAAGIRARNPNSHDIPWSQKCRSKLRRKPSRYGKKKWKDASSYATRDAARVAFTKVRGSEMEHLRADPPFSCISVDGNRAIFFGFTKPECTILENLANSLYYFGNQKKGFFAIWAAELDSWRPGQHLSGPLPSVSSPGFLLRGAP